MSDDDVQFVDAPEVEKYFEEMRATNVATTALQIPGGTAAFATTAESRETAAPATSIFATTAGNQKTDASADNANPATIVDDKDDGETDDNTDPATIASDNNDEEATASLNDADVATVADDNNSTDEKDDTKETDDDDRPLDMNGNPMEEEDNQASHEATMTKVAQDQVIALKANGKMETKNKSRGIVSLEALKAKATEWAETLFLNNETRRVVRIIIKNFTYWDEQFSSHTMVRKLRKEVEKMGLDAVLSGDDTPDDCVLDNHYLKCRIIAISAMVDPTGTSIPSVFYGYRTGHSELSKKWVDLLTQIQTLLHWTANQRVRPPYIKDIAIPYKKPPPKPAPAPKPAPKKNPKPIMPFSLQVEAAPIAAAATKKPATKKPATKKPATKKPATKKPATKKPATKKPATRKRARDDSEDEDSDYEVNSRAAKRKAARKKLGLNW